jgi:hypothetical protein
MSRSYDAISKKIVNQYGSVFHCYLSCFYGTLHMCARIEQEHNDYILPYFCKAINVWFNLFQSHLILHNKVEYPTLTYNGHTQIHSQFSQPHEGRCMPACLCCIHEVSYSWKPNVSLQENRETKEGDCFWPSSSHYRRMTFSATNYIWGFVIGLYTLLIYIVD